MGTSVLDAFMHAIFTNITINNNYQNNIKKGTLILQYSFKYSIIKFDCVSAGHQSFGNMHVVTCVIWLYSTLI